MKVAIVALAASIQLVDHALATEPQVGRWAVDAPSCNGGGDTQRTAPLTVTPTLLYWAGESCSIGKMYKADRALYIEGRCSSGAP